MLDTLFHDQIFRYFLICCNSFSIFIWIVTLVTQNFSQMDRLWPILPMVYSWAFVYTSINYNPEANPNVQTSIIEGNESSKLRLLMMASIITLWGVRLAYAFYRRGYYNMKHEDHRWEFVKKRFGYPERKLSFHIYNFIFMAFVQNWILLGYTLPLWYIQTNSYLREQEPLNKYDLIIFVFAFCFFLLEALADEQQWTFQSNKKLFKENSNTTRFSEEEKEDLKRGFLVKGLFKYSRHPNYFADMLFWWSIYFLTISSQSDFISSQREFSVFHYLNYSIFSTLFMTYLFTKSTRVTETISSSKYAEYKDYKATVNRFIPWFPGYASKKSN